MNLKKLTLSLLLITICFSNFGMSTNSKKQEIASDAKSTQNQKSIFELPDEVLYCICNYLISNAIDRKDLAKIITRFERTCIKFRNLMINETDKGTAIKNTVYQLMQESYAANFENFDFGNYSNKFKTLQLIKVEDPNCSIKTLFYNYNNNYNQLINDALALAIFSKNLELIKKLLEIDIIDVTSATRSGTSALREALIQDDQEIKNLLIAHQGKNNSKKSKTFLNYCTIQ